MIRKCVRLAFRFGDSLGTFQNSAVQHCDHGRQALIPTFEIPPRHSDVGVTDNVEGEFHVAGQLDHITGHTTPETVHATIPFVVDAGALLGERQRPLQGRAAYS